MGADREHRPSGQTGSRRWRDAAAVALAVTSGATDAISFIVFGGAFTSVMTGNLVLLGYSPRLSDHHPARPDAT
jgi:predicted benzoate:H+ symporter BenE